MNERIELPEYIDDIIGRLEKCGHSGYIVGGCVRDRLMGMIPHDYDITTDALPDETAACLRGMRIIETGLRHGTLTVVASGGNAEITTHRIDGEYSDNRRPDKVIYTRSLADDLCRRDFTINAMAYSHRTGIIDLHSGRTHIQQKLIACVGDSDTRFREDGLRILRALRFAAVLGFTIEERTSASVKSCRQLLRNISAERIFSELTGLLRGKNAGQVLAAYSDVISEIIPEIKSGPWTGPDCLINAAAAGIYDGYVRLALFFCGIEKSDVQGILRRLKADNRTIKNVSELADLSDTDIGAGEPQIRRLLSKIPPGQVFRLIAVLRAKYPGKKEHDTAEATIKKLIDGNVCVSLKNLAVNGSDLIKLGIKEGPDIGRILNRLLDMVIEGKIDNSREELISAVSRII